MPRRLSEAWSHPLLDLDTPEQFQPVPDQAIAQPRGDLFLQRLDLGIDEFDDLAGVDIDQVVVVVALGIFIARAAIAEFVLFQNARLFEQLDGAIDRGQRYPRVDPHGAGVKLFDVRMVIGVTDDPRHDPALLGHAQAACFAAVR